MASIPDHERDTQLCIGQYGGHTTEQVVQHFTPTLDRYPDLRLEAVQAPQGSPCIGTATSITEPGVSFHIVTAILYDPSRKARVPYQPAPRLFTMPSGMVVPGGSTILQPHPLITATRNRDGSVGASMINIDRPTPIDVVQRLLTAWQEEVIAPGGPLRLGGRPKRITRETAPWFVERIRDAVAVIEQDESRETGRPASQREVWKKVGAHLGYATPEGFADSCIGKLRELGYRWPNDFRP